MNAAGAEASQNRTDTPGGDLPATGFVLAAILVWIAFCVIHPMIRLAFDLVLGPADTLELIASQDLKLNYRSRQPPFYSWLMWSATQAFGPTPLAVQVVKYGLMAVAGFGFFMAGLAATGDRVRAALGMLMILMIFNVGFTIHDQSTHSVSLIAGLGLLFWGYARLVRHDGWATYLLIAAASAMSVLSKHSAWLVIVAFPLAMLFVPTLRARVLSAKFAISFVLVLLAVTPLLLFLLENRADAAGQLSETISIKQGEGASWLNPLTALGTLVGGWFILAVPVAGLLLIAFGGLARNWRPWLAAALGHDGPVTTVARAWSIGIALIIAIIAIGLLVAGAAKVPSRHLLIAVIPTVLVLAWALPSRTLNARGLMRLLAIVVALQAVTVVSRLAVYAYPGQPLCKRCSHVLPAPDLADAIRARIGEPATLVSDSRVSVGNLRTYLRGTRVVFTWLPKSAAPGPHAANGGARERGCYFLMRRLERQPTGHPSFDMEAIRAATATAEPVTITLKWPRVIGDETRETTWVLLPLPAELDVCGLSG
jgi:hypothetical protein